MKTALKIIFLMNVLWVISCGNYNKDNKTAAEKSWSTVNSTDNSKPLPRHEAAFVAVKDKMYLLGGRGVKNVSIFNPKTQKWTLGAKPPMEFNHYQPVVYNDKIYIIQSLTGKYPSETPVEHIYMYDTAADVWIKGAEIPKDRLRGSTGNVIKNEIVYITCGISNGHIDGHKNWLDSYNIKTDK